MKNKIFLVIFVVLALIPLSPFFQNGLPLTHDGPDHVARIIAFYQNIQEGVLIPRWAGFLNWGYGHPILEFLYPLPSYLASLLQIAGIGLFDSVKSVFILGEILSFAFMYLWLREFLSKESSILGAVLYSYAPYRFIELYVRGDIGENLAFAFMPLVLFFLYKLYKKNDPKFVLLGGIAIAFLILSHNAISLMYMPFIFFYGILLLYKSEKRKTFFVNIITLISFGFALSCFFWLPALIEGKYTLRNIVTRGGFVSHFVSVKSLIYSSWSYGGSGLFSVQLGIVSLLALIFSPLYILKSYKKNKSNLFPLSLFVYSLIAIFLMLPISGFIWSKFILLQNFQFPWRFLAITVFSTAVLAALLLESINKYRRLIIVILILLTVFLSKDQWKANGYFYSLQNLENGIYKGTTDTGESAPIWSVRFMEKKSKAHLEVIDGKAQIKELKRNSTLHKYQVKADIDTLFAENTLYFPGWEITANGKKMNLEFQNMQYRGIMLFHLEKGSYNIEAAYNSTKLRIAAEAVSLAAILILFLFLLKQFVKRYTN